jgi:ribosomal protein S18 acetylase RimI-like enzyme
MKIRPLLKEELNLIRALAHQIWPNAFKEILSRDQIAYMLDLMYSDRSLLEQFDKGHLFFVMMVERRPVGFMAIERHFPEYHQLKIHKLYVNTEIQGMGAGKKLLQKAKEIAEIKGMDEITLNVNRFNKAVGFYKRMGFAIEREEDIQIGNGYLMEDYVMCSILD